MFFKQFKVAGMGCASYLIGSEKSGEAVVVDPTWEVELYLKEAETRLLKIVGIIETHLHADHLSGNRRLAALTGAKIYLHEQAEATFPHEAVKNGRLITLGELEIKVLHTPGHTVESVCLLLTDKNEVAISYLLSGDTLVVGDVGRPDFGGQQGAATLYDSLQREILPLPDDTQVFPAHLAGSWCSRSTSSANFSSLKAEKATNPALQFFNRAEFVDFMTAGLPNTPPNFHRLVGFNRNGPPETEPTLKPLSWEGLQQQLGLGATLVDLREPDSFWQSYLPGSINIPLRLNQPGATSLYFVPPDSPIILVGNNVAEITKARTALAVVGRFEVAGYLLFEQIISHSQSGKDHEIEGSEFLSYLRGISSLILDVRDPGEIKPDEIPQALRLPMRQVPERLCELEVTKEAEMVVVCASGYRSSVITSYLLQKGWKKVRTLKGGMK